MGMSIGCPEGNCTAECGNSSHASDTGNDPHGGPGSVRFWDPDPIPDEDQDHIVQTFLYGNIENDDEKQ